MKAVIIDAGSPQDCQPVTCARKLSDCHVANIPLLAAQIKRVIAAGFEMSDMHSGRGLYVTGAAWLSRQMLATIAAISDPAVIRAGNGLVLAWVGDSSASAPEAKVITADADSFVIRYPWDLLRVNEILLGEVTESSVAGEVSGAAHVDGFIILGQGSRILPGVYVEGTLIVGKNCKIGPNSYIRGCTSVGDNCHIGHAVEVKSSLVMQGASIGHLSYVGDSIIGEKVNLGAGTITANFRHDGLNHRSKVGLDLLDTGRRKFGAVIGDHVHTGINTSIYPGRKLWPNTVTLPGGVVRTDVQG